MVVLGVLGLLAAGLAPAGAHPGTGATARIADASGSVEGDASSFVPAVGAVRRQVAFESDARDPSSRLAPVEQWRRGGWPETVKHEHGLPHTSSGGIGSASLAPPSGARESSTSCRGTAQQCAAWAHVHNDAPAGTVWFEDVAFSADGGTVYAVGTSLGPADLGPGSGVVVAMDAATGTPRWAQDYDHVAYDSGVGVVVAPSGDRIYVIFLSEDDPEVRHLDIAVVAYDADTGQPVWESRYAGPDELHDWAVALDLSAEGDTLVVVGLSESEYEPAYRWDAVALAFEAESGDLAWETRVPGLTGGHAGFEAVAFAPDGGQVYATGWTTTVDGGFEFLTVAMDTTTGGVVWDARYDGPRESGDDFALAVAVAPDGEAVHVTGFSPGESGAPEFVAVAYDADAGDEVWVLRDAAGAWGSARDIAVDPDGRRVYLTGVSSLAGIGWLTMAVEASDGAPVWSSRHSGSNSWIIYGVRLLPSPDGSRLHAAGTTSGDPDAPDVVNEMADVDFGLITYDAATGQELWLAQTTGLPGSMDLPFSMAVDQTTGSIVLAGVSVSVQFGVHVDMPPPFPSPTVAVQESSGIALMFAADGSPLLR